MVAEEWRYSSLNIWIMKTLLMWIKHFRAMEMNRLRLIGCLRNTSEDKVAVKRT